jgi:hypothetical protein
MNKTLSTILIVIAVVVLAGGIFFAGSLYVRANAFLPSMMSGYGWNNTNSLGPGMTLAPGASAGLGGRGFNMMGGYGWNNGTNSNVTPLTVDQAKAAAQKYLANLNNSDLQIAEIMIFNNNAYVAVKEASTGIGAFELLVDPVSQIAYPEYGPNMMWNQKYSGLNHRYMMGGYGGMMGGGYGGMMGGWNYQNVNPPNVSVNMPVIKDQAIKDAQAYLDQYQPGTTAAADPMQFYGYYTLDFSKDGKVVGMLSVNGYSGQVFLHTWHGTFIQEADVQ